MRRSLAFALLFVFLAGAPVAIAAPSRGDGLFGSLLGKLAKVVQIVKRSLEGEVTFPKP
jgi:hypothetical protein